MEKITPRVIKNREFVEFEEEDIQQLNQEEINKFEQSREFRKVKDQIETEMGKRGRWEGHWLAVDGSGKRIYAMMYSNAKKTIAVASDGRIIQEIKYPDQGERTLH